ncbi:MAG: WD40 repeat domain-containing protein [Candidatus Babeliales bacterium]
MENKKNNWKLMTKLKKIALGLYTACAVSSLQCMDLKEASGFQDVPTLNEQLIKYILKHANRYSGAEIARLPKEVSTSLLHTFATNIWGAIMIKQFIVSQNPRDTVEALWLTSCMKDIKHNNKIIVAHRNHTLSIWDMEGNQLGACVGHRETVSSVCVTQDGIIISGAWDGTICLWDMEGTCIGECTGHTGPVMSVCVSCDNNIISGSLDKTVRIWNMNGNLLKTLRGHKAGVLSVSLSQDNKIVSGSEDKTVRIWSNDGAMIAKCKGHLSRVLAVCMTNDNKIVSSSEDGQVLLWNIEGNRIGICKGFLHRRGFGQAPEWVSHCGKVFAIAVTKGNKIITGSQDDGIKIWDPDGNHVAAIQRGHTDIVKAVAALQDTKFVSGSFDGTICIWDMDLNCLDNIDQLQVCVAWHFLKDLTYKLTYKKMDLEACWNQFKAIVNPMMF